MMDFFGETISEISPEGQVLREFSDFGDYYWPSDLYLRDGTLIIAFTGGPMGDSMEYLYYYLDTESWSGSDQPPAGLDISDLPTERW